MNLSAFTAPGALDSGSGAAPAGATIPRRAAASPPDRYRIPEGYSIAPGRYSPNTRRIASEISPRVA